LINTKLCQTSLYIKISIAILSEKNVSRNVVMSSADLKMFGIN